MEILLVLAGVVVIFVGGACGLYAVISLRGLERRVNRIRYDLDALLVRHKQEPAPATPTSARYVSPPVEPEPPSKPAVLLTPTTPPPHEQPDLGPEPPSFEPMRVSPSPIQSELNFREQWSAFEITVGSKWLNWTGVVLVTVGVMFFLKYAYDNQWIGPTGRLAIAGLAGAAALVLGEKFRRRGYPILFQALTGGGLAIFYGCIFFSFQVYQLMGQSAAFGAAIAVTALAVAMAVIHDAPAICLLGQLGGFLSPVLISTGQNRPVELFSFLTILNLATMACAYFKSWRHVNTLAFVGTWFLYAGWATKFYDPAQIGTALAFSTLFYLLFLIVPTLGALAQGKELPAESLWLVAVDIVVEFVNNYGLLYWDYRSWLGPAVIVQALPLSALYAYWIYRSWEDTKARATMLVSILALVTVAIPIQLRFYGIPIGWAMESIVVGFVGLQYRHRLFQFAAMVATVLAALGLVARLPLHTELFTPIFNRPFGSWAIVIGMAFALSALFQKHRDALAASLKNGPVAIFGLAVVLLCGLIHGEISTFWSVRAGILKTEFALSYQQTSLTLLWAVVPLVFLWLGRNLNVRFSIPAALTAYAVGLLVILKGAAEGDWLALDVPFLNLQWLSRFVFVAALWIGANWMRSVHDRPQRWQGWPSLLRFVEALGHVMLVFLLYAEVDTWLSASRVFSSFMRFGFVSALWSLQALALIAIGLRARNQFRRILGFVLFGITVAKVLAIDMAVLQPVYRILSFAATGVLLIVAAYLYQKFAKTLLEDRPRRAETDTP